MRCNTLFRARGKNVIFLLIIAIGFLAVQSQAIAGTETNITTELSGTDESEPDIFGDRIVWVDTGSGTTNVYLYTLSTGHTTCLSDPLGGLNDGNPDIYDGWVGLQTCSDLNCDINLYNISADPPMVTLVTSGTEDSSQENPAVSGNYIVWQDDRNGFSDLYLYDIQNGTTEVITAGTEDSNQVNPAISGNYIAWQDDRNELFGLGYYDIYLYDIATATITNLTSGTDDSIQAFPAISGNYVVWQDSRNDPYGMDLHDIFLYNIETGTVTNLTPDTDDSDQSHPAIDGNYVIWQDNRDGDDNIYFYDIATGNDPVPITNNPDHQYTPAISGNRIVWKDMRNGNEDIFLFTLGVDNVCPLANFSTDITSGPSLLAVQFNDTSIGSSSDDTFSWNFGDGETSIERNPNHTYAVAATYDVTLTVSNPYCRSAVLKPVGVLPTASFMASPTSGGSLSSSSSRMPPQETRPPGPGSLETALL